MTQPEQDWLPISIPHTYLMIPSSEEEDNDVVFMLHLPLLALTIPGRYYPAQPVTGTELSEKPDHPR